jgi:hypothetical protein
VFSGSIIAGQQVCRVHLLGAYWISKAYTGSRSCSDPLQVKYLSMLAASLTLLECHSVVQVPFSQLKFHLFAMKSAVDKLPRLSVSHLRAKTANHRAFSIVQ